MRFQKAEMRIANGMPLGLRVVISLTDSDAKLISSTINVKHEERMGVTIHDNELIIAPANSAATIEQVAIKHILTFITRNSEQLDPTIKTELEAIAKALVQFGDKNPLVLGKSGKEQKYEEKVGKSLLKFSSMFNEIQVYDAAFKNFVEGMKHYKLGKLAAAKACFERFEHAVEDMHKSHYPRLKTAITESVGVMGKGFEDPVISAKTLLEGINKLLAAKDEAEETRESKGHH